MPEGPLNTSLTGVNVNRNRYKVNYWEDPVVKELVCDIVRTLGLEYIDMDRLYCFRSRGSRSKVYARIYGLPRILQKALRTAAIYVIEIVSENFDRLSEEERLKVLIHELLHIPYTFSGALRPHNSKLDDEVVEELYRSYKSRKSGNI